MKAQLKSLFGLTLAVGTVWCSLATEAQAGPLLDWLRGLRNRNQPTMPVAACGLQPGQCQTTCQQQCSRVVVNYVPYTAYRTNWEQVPVTQYKPVTNTDPCTGCTVTCMKPCTNYTWQMKQVPYTTYRPVYRTESYSVPVTYVTQADSGCSTCSTGYQPAVAGCSTCGVNPGTVVPGTTVPPYYPAAPGSTVVPGPTTSSYWTVPNGALSTSGTYTALPGSTGYGVSPNPATPTPADVTPSLDGASAPGIQRSIIEQMRNTSTSTFGDNREFRTTQTADANAVTSASHSAVQQTWTYSPVRLASHENLVTDRRQIEKLNLIEGRVAGSENRSPREFVGTLRQAEPAQTKLVPAKQVNSDWSSASW